MNPSKFLYKKGRPRISKKRNKMVSRAKAHGNAHIQQYHLDAMMAPVVSITKRDYGCDECHCDSGVTIYELPQRGNLPSIHCQTGRQVYLEFLGLPLVEYAPRPAGTYRRTWSFIELLTMAFRRNMWLNSTQNKGLQTLDPDDAALFNTLTLPTGTYNSGNSISDGGATYTSLLKFAQDEVNDTLTNFNFCYMGGYQEHIFSNATNAPVHLEFREYSPRQPMGFDNVRRMVKTPVTGTLYSFVALAGVTSTTRNIVATDKVMIVSTGNTNWGLGGAPSAYPPTNTFFTATAGITSGTGTYYLWTEANVDNKQYPLLYTTMYADLLRGLKTHADTTSLTAHLNSDLNQQTLFDEIDDKGFKYRKGVMVDTDFRFKVSEKKVKTLYPGEKYSYKMVFPPFTGNSLQFAQALQRYNSYISTGTGYGTKGYTPCVMPSFTKGLQVRAIGSQAYLKPTGHTDYGNRSYYAYDNNNDAPGSGTSASNYGLDPNFNVDNPIKLHATHAVRLTHEVKEHHSMKCLPTYKAYHAFNTNFIANAANSSDILPGDQMEIIDPVENDMEVVIGDGVSGA